jgi:hypothetical protein
MIKNVLAWKAALIASALSHPVWDLVLGYSDVKDIWDKLVWVNEEIIFQ